MRIIPVLDILNSQVVHGVKGERHKYAPIQSVLTSKTTPLDVTQTFKDLFFITELYVADLDAILHQKFMFSYLEELISQTNLQIMLDAGIDEEMAVQNLLKRGVYKVIIGTETLQSITNLQRILAVTSPKDLIISLDLKQGRIFTKAKELLTKSPLDAALLFEKLGIQEIIVLELTKVGSESGVMTKTLEKILQKTSLTIITGGGARNIQDLRDLQKAGVSGVLVATALHNGSITPNELASL